MRPDCCWQGCAVVRIMPTGMLVLVPSPPSMFATYQPESSSQTPIDGIVREATDGDVESCLRIMMAREAGSQVQGRARLRQCIESDADGFFVAEVDGRVAGFGRVQLFTPPPEAPLNVVPLGWYLIGVMVDSRWRRRGLGDALTVARLGCVQQRANEVWYFANARNQASVDLHSKYGFVEVTRDFTVADVTFDDGMGTGILFRCPQLRQG
jgi:ribosomal protein S18 acetylase RimI-like enzyme